MSPPNANLTENLSAAMRLIAEVLGPDATIGQMEVLLLVINDSNREEKDVRQEDIGFKLKRRQGTVARQLDKWVELGILSKNISSESEREKTYQLTRDGRRFITSVEQALKG